MPGPGAARGHRAGRRVNARAPAAPRSDRRGLLRLLLDNQYHSGARLAAALGVSRTAAWNGVRRLRELGLTIDARHGKGYRLRDRIELLNAAVIRRELGDTAARCRVQVLLDADSTNSRLSERFGQAGLHRCAVLAERQRAGRGRRGKSWESPFARSLYLSLGWRFERAPAAFNALSLAAGVAVIRALARLDVAGLHLKWPNDILSNGRKLGGILLETKGESAGACDVVIGTGLNVRLPAATLAAIDQPATDLARRCGRPPSRNRLAAKIIEEQLLMLDRVSAAGMGDYVDAWRRLDGLAGQRARLTLPGQTLRGLVRGVDDNGLLLLETADGVAAFSSGELRLEAAP